MGKSTRIRLTDFRRCYQIVNEVVELGNDPEVWQRHMGHALIELLRLQSCHLYVMPLPIRPENVHLAKMGLYGLDETANRMWNEYGRQGDLSTDPCTPEILSRIEMGRPFTAVRTMLATDRDWYESGYYHDFKRTMRADDILVSIVPMPEIGIIHGIGGDRRCGEKPMGRRETVCSGIIHQELSRRWKRALSSCTAVEANLPRRLKELLGYLRGADSEKQIAAYMGLSPHTVHNHIRRLYARFNVRSRAELFVRDAHGPRVGIPRLGIAGL